MKRSKSTFKLDYSEMEARRVLAGLFQGPVEPDGVSASITSAEAAIVINELMADNDVTIEDPDEAGAFEDWIELFNPGAEAVDLSGFYLTDDVSNPAQWAFSAGATIDAGGYLTVWADGESDQGDLHASFMLSSGGETVALYAPDGTLIDSIEFGAQVSDISYGRSPNGADTLGSLASATPGSANAAIITVNIDPYANAGGPYTTNVGDTITLSGSDSQDSDGSIASYAWDFDGDGLYDDASGETVSYTATTEGITIIGLQVTDDGGGTSTDTATTQTLAAGETASPWDPTLVDDEAAAFFDDSYVHEIYITFDDPNWFDTLVESHENDPDDPYLVADFVGDGIALNEVGVRFKGNSSFSGTNEKNSLKIDFNEFDSDALTFLGLKKLNLNNNYNDPTMLREKLFYDYASNFVEGVGRAVHTKVYINGAYYGLYTAVEQVDSTFTETHFGDGEDGNLYKGTASDDLNDDPSADFGSDLTYLGTDQAAYEAFYDLKTNESANDYSQLIELIDVLNNTPSSELAEAIEPLLDVDDTLAAMALNNLFVNIDSYSGAAHNYYLYDQDSSGQFHHVIWDVNESFGSFTRFLERGQDPVEIEALWLPADVTTGRPGAGSTEEQPRPLMENLWAVDEYEAEYLRQLSLMLLEGFDVTTASERINELADLIRDDVYADPNKPFTNTEFEQNLSSDVNVGNRTVYGLTGFIEDRSNFLATELNADIGPTDATQAELRISELHFNPAAPSVAEIAAGFDDNDDFEFIEIYNSSSTGSIGLSGVSFSDGVTFEFGDLDYLLPGERAVVVEDIDAFMMRYGDSATVLGEWSGGLSNGGESLTLLDSSMDEIMSVNYQDNDPWYQAADGDGFSLVLDDPANTPVEELGKYYNWRASTELGGTPGTASAAQSGVVINEVLANTDQSPSDAIELFNPTDAAIDVGGWYLSDEGNDLLKFQIPTGTVISAGGYLVFDESDFNAAGNGFALTSTGDEVYLSEASNGFFIGLQDAVEFDATFGGESLGRLPNGSGRLTRLAANSFGSVNGEAEVGPLVINEVNYHPDDPSSAALAIDSTLTDNDLEFIEIANPTSATIDLTDWRIRGDADFDFAAGTSLGPGEAILLVSFDPALEPAKLEAFQAHYDLSSAVTIVGGLAGSLSNSTGRIALQQPDVADAFGEIAHVVVDELVYDDLAPWPDADGSGQSLHRDDVDASGNLATSWTADAATPGVFESSFLLGDTNQDGVVNFLDISPFISLLSSGDFLAEADINGDGEVDFLDISPFIGLLSSGT